MVDFDIDRARPFLIGAIGALITALKFTPGATWIERAVNVVAGSLIAGFTTPALIEWLHMTSSGYTNGAAFVVGLLGMSLVAAALDWLKSGKLGEILSSWGTRR